jgi:Pvc16 N-terminal domain
VSGHAGIASTLEAVVRVLRAAYDPADFNGAVLDFQVYVSDDFTHPMEQGVSLFLYRIYPNGAVRAPQGRLLPDGRRQRTKLPLDLHFLATAWARKASLQHEIAGWMMRVIEDNPVLTADLLNAPRPGVFQPEETVALNHTDLSVEDTFRIWDTVIDHSYQLSVPYVARTVEIESPRLDGYGTVQERVFAPGQLVTT